MLSTCGGVLNLLAEQVSRAKGGHLRAPAEQCNAPTPNSCGAQVGGRASCASPCATCQPCVAGQSTRHAAHAPRRHTRRCMRQRRCPCTQRTPLPHSNAPARAPHALGRIMRGRHCASHSDCGAAHSVKCTPTSSSCLQTHGPCARRGTCAGAGRTRARMKGWARAGRARGPQESKGQGARPGCVPERNAAREAANATQQRPPAACVCAMCVCMYACVRACNVHALGDGHDVLPEAPADEVHGHAALVQRLDQAHDALRRMRARAVVEGGCRGHAQRCMHSAGPWRLLPAAAAHRASTQARGLARMAPLPSLAPPNHRAPRALVTLISGGCCCTKRCTSSGVQLMMRRTSSSVSLRFMDPSLACVGRAVCACVLVPLVVR